MKEIYCITTRVPSRGLSTATYRINLSRIAQMKKYVGDDCKPPDEEHFQNEVFQQTCNGKIE